MKLIGGLGNPGKLHEKTRHNLGFVVVEKFLKDFEPIRQTQWERDDSFKSDVARIEWGRKVGPLEKVILAKPQTYMNNSGLAISLLAGFYKIKPEDLWIVHDDIDLPVGTLRIRMGGSSAGHKGIQSTIDKLGTEKFWRFRLGISHPKRNLKFDPPAGGRNKKQSLKAVDQFVLEPFATDEQGSVKHLIKHASKAIGEALENGIESAMNKYNTK